MLCHCVSCGLPTYCLLFFWKLIPFLLFRMATSSEWTDIPVQLQVFQRLLVDTAPAWCSDNLPTTALEPASTLPVALAWAFDMTEPLLRLSVKCLLLELDPDSALVVDAWFQKQGLSLLQYLSCVSTVESWGGWFVCLALCESLQSTPKCHPWKWNLVYKALVYSKLRRCSYHLNPWFLSG